MADGLNSDWKETGKNLGSAFKGLGKSIKGEVTNDPQNDPTKEDWKETGKDIGHAFKGLGKTLIKTAKTGIDKAGDWAEKDDKKELPDEPKE
ncbi:MAG: hypothetical protein MJ166_03840 [Clostridia bacterium]|nr:hypothetical protein [Clostridia bacterium]